MSSIPPRSSGRTGHHSVLLLSGNLRLGPSCWKLKGVWASALIISLAVCPETLQMLGRETGSANMLLYSERIHCLLASNQGPEHMGTDTHSH